MHTDQRILERRAMIQRETDWALYRRQRELMHLLFPSTFSAPGSSEKVPLATGIKEEIIASIGATVDGFAAEDVSLFLRAYTFGPKYLLAMRAGADRFALNGKPRGKVSRSDEWFAKRNLRMHVSMYGSPAAQMAEAA